MKDNNGDDVADVIFINEYQSFVVDRVSGNTIYWRDGQQWNGKEFLHFDETDQYLTYEIRNKQGEKLELADIQSGNIVSVFSSEDEQVFELAVSDQRIEGTLESIDDDEVSINGVAYQLADGLEILLEPGDSVTAYQDYMDRIVYLDEGGITSSIIWLCSPDRSKQCDDEQYLCTDG